MPRLIPLAIASALLISAGLYAQEPEPPIDLEPVRQRVKQLLWSPLPKDQAWGAYLVGDLSLHELAPDLIDFIKRESPGGFDGDREYVLRAAVDSMIRLKISPPQGLLDSYVDVVRDELVILYARDPVPHSTALLGMLQDEHRDSARRYALFAAAMEARTPGLAAWLLQGLEIYATLWIVPGQLGPGSGSDGVSGIVEVVSGRPRPTDFPPDILYQVQFSAGPDSSVLIPGPRSVYFNRLDLTGGEVKSFTRVIHQLDVFERLGYIAALGGYSSPGMPLKADYTSKIVLPKGADIAAERQTLIVGIEVDYAKVIQSLFDRGLIYANEARAFTPNINLTVRDQR